MAPPSPARNPDTAKAISRARPAEMPIDCAASSLPRSAWRVLPTVPPRIRITATDASARTTTDSTRKARSSAKSHGPSTGRGTRVPWSSEVPPPPIQSSFTMTESKKYANARVAIATQIPPRRRTGSDTSAARIAATQRADERTGHDRQVVAIDELEDREAPDGGERSLAQRDLPGEPGHDRDREEDRGEDHRLGDEEEPTGVGLGVDDVADDAEEHDAEDPRGPGEVLGTRLGGQRGRRRVDP